uniref:Uncharacterized protein n=1 Tax=Magallana gigas TaxID=29159 RepID=K1QQP3_MAGGI
MQTNIFFTAQFPHSVSPIYCMPAAEADRPGKVFVGGLASDIDEAVLEKYFSHYGRLTEGPHPGEVDSEGHLVEVEGVGEEEGEVEEDPEGEWVMDIWTEVDHQYDRDQIGEDQTGILAGQTEEGEMVLMVHKGAWGCNFVNASVFSFNLIDEFEHRQMLDEEKPWITPELLVLVRQKDEMQEWANKCPSLVAEYRKFRNHVRMKVRKAKIQYEDPTGEKREAEFNMRMLKKGLTPEEIEKRKAAPRPETHHGGKKYTPPVIYPGNLSGAASMKLNDASETVSVTRDPEVFQQKSKFVNLLSKQSKTVYESFQKTHVTQSNWSEDQDEGFSQGYGGGDKAPNPQLPSASFSKVPNSNFVQPVGYPQTQGYSQGNAKFNLQIPPPGWSTNVNKQNQAVTSGIYQGYATASYASTTTNTDNSKAFNQSSSETTPNPWAQAMSDYWNQSAQASSFGKFQGASFASTNASQIQPSASFTQSSVNQMQPFASQTMSSPYQHYTNLPTQSSAQQTADFGGDRYGGMDRGAPPRSRDPPMSRGRDYSPSSRDFGRGSAPDRMSRGSARDFQSSRYDPPPRDFSPPPRDFHSSRDMIIERGPTSRDRMSTRDYGSPQNTRDFGGSMSRGGSSMYAGSRDQGMGSREVYVGGRDRDLPSSRDYMTSREFSSRGGSSRGGLSRGGGEFDRGQPLDDSYRDSGRGGPLSRGPPSRGFSSMEASLVAVRPPTEARLPEDHPLEGYPPADPLPGMTGTEEVIPLGRDALQTWIPEEEDPP